MKRVTLRWALVIGVFAAPGALAAGAPEERMEQTPEASPSVITTPADHSLAPLRDELRRRVNEGDIRAISVIAIRGDQVVWEQGFGWADPERRLAASSRTIYPVASISKSFVGLAATILIDEERLSLDDRVDRVLTSFDLTTAPWVTAPLRVRDLFQMTAGMPHGGVTWLRDATDGAAESRRAVTRLAVVVDEPGGDFAYSNYTSGVLERVVEDVSGEALEQFLRRRVFEPAGMRTTVVAPDEDDPRLVEVHSGDHVFRPRPVMAPASGHGFWSSTADLAAFARLHLSPSGGAPPARVITASRGDAGVETDAPGAYWSGWGEFGGGDALFEMTNGQGWDATSCIIICPAEGAAAICVTNSLWNDQPGGERVADAVAMDIIDALVGGCREAYTKAAGEFEAAQVTPDDAEEMTLLNALGDWSGELILEGATHPATLTVRKDGAELRFGSVEATTDAVGIDGDTLEARFRCDGEFGFFGEVSALSGVVAQLKRIESARLGGSLEVVAFDTDRATVGSGFGILDLRRREDAP